MADKSKFGGPTQFGDTTAGNQTGDTGHCARCEAMLAGALAGTLSAEDQALFDGHITDCGSCSQLLAEAKRGAAWLQMLRGPEPAPPADLVEKIFAQTSGGPIAVSAAHSGNVAGTPALASGYAPGVGHPAVYRNVIPFRQRILTTLLHSGLQPRLAMTAAMAFFSIALTMNLTGVRLSDLSLRPSVLKREFSAANASVARYYEGLRVVYELESRLHDLQTVQADEGPGSKQNAPQLQSNPGQSPAKKPTDTKPQRNQRHGTGAPPAASRREDRHQGNHEVGAIGEMEIDGLTGETSCVGNSTQGDVSTDAPSDESQGGAKDLVRMSFSLDML